MKLHMQILIALGLGIKRNGHIFLGIIGGIIVGTEGITDAYKTGRGRITIRGRVEEETPGRGKTWLVIKEIPFSQNKTTLIEAIAKAIQNGVIDGINDLRDESDRTGIRIVLDLQKDADKDKVLKQLYAKTPLQSTYGIINLAICGSTTKEYGLKDLIEIFLTHRKTVVKRRTEHRLKVVNQKLHITEGLLKALGQIDKNIRLIKTSENAAEAKTALVEKMKFSAEQAQAILDMRLQRLTGLERSKLEADKAALEKEKANLEKILSGDKALNTVIKAELKDIKAKYADTRRTTILPA